MNLRAPNALSNCYCIKVQVFWEGHKIIIIVIDFASNLTYSREIWHWIEKVRVISKVIIFQSEFFLRLLNKNLLSNFTANCHLPIYLLGVSHFRAKVHSTSNFCSNDNKKASFEENWSVLIWYVIVYIYFVQETKCNKMGLNNF